MLANECIIKRVNISEKIKKCNNNQGEHVILDLINKMKIPHTVKMKSNWIEKIDSQSILFIQMEKCLNDLNQIKIKEEK